MAKLYFMYGVMGSSKTAMALMTHYKYKERGKNALLLKPSIDIRDGEKIIRSRVGMEQPCLLIEDLPGLKNIKQYDCLIVDEAQFLTKQQVLMLEFIVDSMKVPVICFGLRTDYKGGLFSGSKALFELADSIEEIKTICWCGRKAIMNARFDANGKVIKEGEQVILGADDQYIGLCRKHWRDGRIKDDGMEG